MIWEKGNWLENKKKEKLSLSPDDCENVKSTVTNDMHVRIIKFEDTNSSILDIEHSYRKDWKTTISFSSI